MSRTCPKCGYEGRMSNTARGGAKHRRIIEDYQRTGSIIDTARKFWVSRQYISQFLKAKGIKTRPNRQFHAMRVLITDTNVASFYHQGFTNIEIARSTGLTLPTVSRSLKRQGLLKHPGQLIRSERARHAIQLFDDGHALSMIAEKCGYKNEASARTLLWKHNRRFQRGVAINV
jgi:AraC-like DNA-binding protein